jgi:diadenosine tetraphosphate (Ap4A) HIT family hydrolase
METAEDGFSLDPRLATDTLFVTNWSLSRVLLMNDARYDWLVLVPRRFGIGEMHELSSVDRNLLADEIARAAMALKGQSTTDKINIGMLGNIVPQLHVHVVLRRLGDPAWPGPVWGHSPREPMAISEAGLRIARLRARL